MDKCYQFSGEKGEIKMNVRKMIIFKCFVSLLALVFAFTTSAGAQSVTVNSAGGADYTSVQAALTAVSSSAAEPDVITIVGGGPYAGGYAIGSPVAIRGESPDNRPILLLAQNGSVSGRETSGIANAAAVDIVLENLILLPALENKPTRAVNIEPLSNSDNFSLTVRNVLLTSNNGSNQPLSTDGLELKDFTGATSFGDDGFWILGTFSGRPSGTVHGQFENVIVTHLDDDSTVSSMSLRNQDGFVIGGENTSVTFINVISSYNDRWGMQLLSDLTAHLEGTPDKPIICKGCGSAGILCYSGHHKWSYVELLDNPLGTRIDADTNLSFVADHLTVANSSETGLGVFWTPTTLKEFPISSSTFYNNKRNVAIVPVDAENAARSDQVTVVLKDSIFAGFVDQTFLETEMIEGADQKFSNVIIDYCAVVEEGEHAIFYGFRDEKITETAVIKADPAFLSVDPTSDDYLKVSADAYRGAASGGGDLKGSKLFAGETTVTNWMIH